MMHKRRVWCVSPVTSPEELACMLTEQTWTLCSGFYLLGYPDYLFLNDATHEDGAAEFAVVKGKIYNETHAQIESITFSWCTVEAALGHIDKVSAGAYDTAADVPLRLMLETPEQHGVCRHCA